MVSKNIMKELFPDYGKIHHWLAKNYGKANRCEHCKKNGLKYEWALLKGKEYTKDVDSFIQLCITCHRKYDMTESKRQKNREKGMTNKNEDKRRAVIRIDPITDEKKRYESVRSAAIEYKIHHTAIVFAIKKNGKSKGYFWKYETAE